MAGKKRHTQAEVIDALRLTGGIITDAARKLELASSKGLRERIRTTPALLEVLEEIREETKDLAEGNILKALKDNDKDISKWYLASLARDRGFGNKSEIELKGNLTVERRDLSKLSDEELSALEETLKKLEPPQTG